MNFVLLYYVGFLLNYKIFYVCDFIFYGVYVCLLMWSEGKVILNILIFFCLFWMMVRKICSKFFDLLGCKESLKLKCVMYNVVCVLC